MIEIPIVVAGVSVALAFFAGRSSGAASVVRSAERQAEVVAKLRNPNPGEFVVVPDTTNRDPAEISNAQASHFVQMMAMVSGALHEGNRRQGFWDKPREDGTMIALMHSELSEMLEYSRKNPDAPSDHIPEFSGVEEEAADTVIRVMDFCQGRGFRLGAAIIAKVRYNQTRPFMHGKKF